MLIQRIHLWGYKISVRDSCGNESSLSSFHETIHLTTNLGLGGEVNLIWDDYEGFAFSEYEIWRDSTGDGDWETIGTTLSSSFTYTDNNVPQNAIELNYAVEISLPYTCIAEKAQDHNTTRSNKHTIAGPGAKTAASISVDILEKLKLFPNPTTDIINIKLNAENWQYQITDLSGRLITRGYSTKNEQSIDISNLESGLYLIVVELNGHSTTKRIVKQ